MNPSWTLLGKEAVRLHPPNIILTFCQKRQSAAKFTPKGLAKVKSSTYCTSFISSGRENNAKKKGYIYNMICCSWHYLQVLLSLSAPPWSCFWRLLCKHTFRCLCFLSFARCYSTCCQVTSPVFRWGSCYWLEPWLPFKTFLYIWYFSCRLEIESLVLILKTKHKSSSHQCSISSYFFFFWPLRLTSQQPPLWLYSFLSYSIS